MLLVDGGALAYFCIGSPEYYFEPWSCTDALVEQGAIICIDSSRSLRRERYDWYKTNREEVSPVFDAMRIKAHQWRIDAIARYGLDTCRAIDGLEADDLIGLYASPGDTVMSPDKDMLQLVGVNLIDCNGREWATDRLSKFSKQNLAQGERFLAYQTCVGDVTDSIPRLLYTKDRRTIPTIMKHEHPLWLLSQMVNEEKLVAHLNCLLIPTPLYTEVDTLQFCAERYGYA